MLAEGGFCSKLGGKSFASKEVLSTQILMLSTIAIDSMLLLILMFNIFPIFITAEAYVDLLLFIK
jgi:hypothetical protein